ncbi:hypothetical protein BOX15_Mlig031525g2 [Macrostomum lignano]|uniref:Uncharacterized protein n=2 Tax=Macrostomum lignano TaxID=282301 RepID=A0A267DP93_9PLAT|nr:hypothetical protein BOX15_Mlig031525g3 [Macrostomum lignano]PAA50976.1 hypothetical protein BOX15_Mlig031525g2 [Macrostomum lignano]
MSRRKNWRVLSLLLCLLMAVALLHRCSVSRDRPRPRLIPRILHQVGESELVFAEYSFAIESCRRLNPNWTYILWRDKDAELLIKEFFPDFYRTQYAKYTNRLKKSDSIRYIILYLFGGLYADLDVECMKPFSPDLDEEACFLDQENPAQSHIFWNKERSAMNSVMGCRPGHPFMLDLVSRMAESPSNQAVMLSTGPLMLTKALDEWTAQGSQRDWADSVRLMDPDIFSPHVDNADILMDACRKRFGQPANDGELWVDRGCRDLQFGGLKDNFTERTVAVHWFMHLGWYSLKEREHIQRINISRLVPGVRFYREHHAQLKQLIKATPPALGNNKIKDADEAEQ